MNRQRRWPGAFAPGQQLLGVWTRLWTLLSPYPPVDGYGAPGTGEGSETAGEGTEGAGRSGSAPCNVTVTWQRPRYRERASWSLQAGPLAPGLQAQVTRSAGNARWFPADVTIPVAQTAQWASCSGRIGQGQALRVTITNAVGERCSGAHLTYTNGRLSDDGGASSDWLQIRRTGSQTSWEDERLRLARAGLLLYGLALVWELFVFFWRTSGAQWREFVGGCILLLLWNAIGLYLNRWRFQINRVLLPLCILGGGVLYWLYPLWHGWHP
jgi:hypothetical protein